MDMVDRHSLCNRVGKPLDLAFDLTLAALDRVARPGGNLVALILLSVAK